MNINTPWFETVKQLEDKDQAYVLITVMGVLGSTPRNSGTKMVVSLSETNLNETSDETSSHSRLSFGTIGGGHLEHKAIEIALELLVKSKKTNKAMQHIEHFPLGAKLGQCCGGQTSILFESFIGSELNIMLFGAGHVGKSLASILAQLPCQLHWVDNRDEQFPHHQDLLSLGSNVKKIISDTPEDEVKTMPTNSFFIVMTHNHALDFNISNAILTRNDAQYIGLIGSKTKWQRFKMRFEHKGITDRDYQKIHCPIGLSEVPGKLPIEVAVSVAAEIINFYQKNKQDPFYQKENRQNKQSIRQGVTWQELRPIAEQLSIENEQ